MKNRKNFMICIILMSLTFALAGCGDAYFEDDYIDEYDQGYDGYSDDEYCDDDYYNDYEDYDQYDSYSDEDYGFYDMEVPENTNLNAVDYPIGTCSEMEGTTILVSIFLDDVNTSWNSNRSVIQDALEYTGIATEWVSQSVSAYGCQSHFIYDWNNYPDLYYEGTVSEDMVDIDTYGDYVDYTAWKFVDEHVDSQALLQKYNADNIGYLFYLNTPESNNMTSCTRNFYEGMDYPYEMCYIYMFCEGEEESPASIAHEILHLFGAPDLYLEDTDGDNYGVSRQLVSELERTRSNDIMYTTYDAKKDIAYYDRISNELSEVDAYYIGIIDSCDFVREWNLQPSQHQ